MNTDQIVNIVVAILTGLAAGIPLAVKLYQSVKQAVQEKNWPHLLGLVVDLMEEAEQKFADGRHAEGVGYGDGPDQRRVHQLPRGHRGAVQND